MALLRGEVGERGNFAHVNAQGATRGYVRKRNFQGLRRLIHLRCLHGRARNVLLLIVSRTRGYILIYDKRPVTFRRKVGFRRWKL